MRTGCLTLRVLLAKQQGATAAEYAVLVALIALVIVAGVAAFGGALNEYFENVVPQLPFS